MIRFITHILDVLNVLGMQRVVPMPTHPANELVMRAAADGNVDYTATFTGNLIVQANGETDTYPDTYSGIQIGVAGVAANTDIVLTGNITKIFFLGMANISMLVVNNTTTNFAVSQNMKILDLRNANLISGFVINSDNLSQVYAIANTIAQKNISVDMITNSSVSNGILWIDGSQTYAADVIAAAQAKGWMVRFL